MKRISKNIKKNKKATKEKTVTKVKAKKVKEDKKKGSVKIFIISGPGGVGKTTLVKHIFENKKIKKDFIRGISVTTREKREHEKEDKDYFFVTNEEFDRLESRGFFMESERILGHAYGTPRMFYLLAKKKGQGLILCIDVKGGMHLKKKTKADRISTIFIDTPTKKELYKRLEKREVEKSTRDKKIKLAKEEMKAVKKYDFVVINKEVEGAVKELESIILANND